MPEAVVVGSGPGGCTAAMALALAGWDVTVLEKGRNHYGDLTSPTPETRYANDELKMRRGFGRADPELEPRTFRWRADQDEPLHIGHVNTIPGAVGGGTSVWDAKVPRLWDIDFAKRTMLGPVDGADVVDWPFSYDEIAPWYDAAEVLLGAAGDLDALPALLRERAPRATPFPQSPGVQMRSALLLADGARRLELNPYPFMEAVNSAPYDGRPACIHCGHCSFFGCPIHDRGSALVPLRLALRTGRARLLADTVATRVVHDGRRASGVVASDADGERTLPTDLVVLAAGAVDTCRLALLSELPDESGLLGRCLMFHWVTYGYGIWLSERLHGNRGRNVTQAIDDFADPEFRGARDAAKAAGLPYVRGGVVELGGTPMVIEEALQYLDLLEQFHPEKPFGRRFKQLMRFSPMRDRLAGAQMIAEDLAQRTNTVDLDPRVRDRLGLPAARITYKPHAHELVAQDFYVPWLDRLARAAGADATGALGTVGTEGRPSLTGQITPTGSHLMGGMRMGTDARSSVTDGHGRLWGLDNVGVADAAVFPTSGAHNPTLTIVATAWRNARAWAGVEGIPDVAPVGAAPIELAGAVDRGGDLAKVVGIAGVAAAGAVAAHEVVRGRSRPAP